MWLFITKMQFLLFLNDSNVSDTVLYGIVFEQETTCVTHCAAAFFFITYSVKMQCIIVFGIFDTPSISHTVVHLSLSINVDTISIRVLSIVVEGWLVCRSSSVNLLPSWNILNHLATVLVHCIMAACLAWISNNNCHCITKHSILIYMLVALFSWNDLNKFLGLLRCCVLFLHNVSRRKICICFICKTSHYILTFLAHQLHSLFWS